MIYSFFGQARKVTMKYHSIVDFVLVVVSQILYSF